jgi:hypothetical protein
VCPEFDQPICCQAAAQLYLGKKQLAVKP